MDLVPLPFGQSTLLVNTTVHVPVVVQNLARVRQPVVVVVDVILMEGETTTLLQERILLRVLRRIGGQQSRRVDLTVAGAFVPLPVRPPRGSLHGLEKLVHAYLVTGKTLPREGQETGNHGCRVRCSARVVELAVDWRSRHDFTNCRECYPVSIVRVVGNGAILLERSDTDDSSPHTQFVIRVVLAVVTDGCNDRNTRDSRARNSPAHR